MSDEQLKAQCDHIAKTIENGIDVFMNDDEHDRWHAGESCEESIEVEQDEDGDWIIQTRHEDDPEDGVAEVTTMSGYDYIADVLDIEYRIGSDGEYRSAELLVAYGGPNIWIDTGTKTVRGAWRGSSAETRYYDTAMDLDSTMEDLYRAIMITL